MAQWQKGQSGNLNGRPKAEWTFSGLLQEVAEEIDDKSGLSFKKALARKLYTEAVKGNIVAIREIINRTEGLPRQQKDNNDEDRNLSIHFDKCLEQET